MFFGALLAGVLPFRLGIAENRQNMATQRWTVFGSGLLVGAVLIIIIPEGMEAMYGGHSDTATTLLGLAWHAWVGPTLALGFAFMLLVDQAASMPKRRPRSRSMLTPLPLQPTTTAAVAASVTATAYASTPTATNFASTLATSPRLSNIGTATTNPFSSSTASSSITAEAERNRRMVTSPVNYPGAESRTSSATLGLLVHAAADGVAMGAAATTGSDQLEFVIFAAVLLHKAPAAFGLTTFLLREGYPRLQVIHRLLAFAAAAPLAALLTFGVLMLSFLASGIDVDNAGLSAEQLMRLRRSTGLILLFSAGTFLYVATAHALPDTLSILRGSAQHVQHAHNYEANVTNTATIVAVDADDECLYSAGEEEEDGEGEGEGDTDEEILLQDRASPPQSTSSNAAAGNGGGLNIYTGEHGLEGQVGGMSDGLPLSAKRLPNLLNVLAVPRSSRKYARRWSKRKRPRTRRLRADSRTIPRSGHGLRDGWSLVAFLIGMFAPVLFSIGHEH
jgi:zinc transporter 9